MMKVISCGGSLSGGSKRVDEKYKEEFNPEEIRYINASTGLEEKEWAEKERIRSRTIKGLAVFSIVILSLAILATKSMGSNRSQFKRISCKLFNL